MKSINCIFASVFKTEKSPAVQNIILVSILMFVSFAYFLPLIKFGYFPLTHETERYVQLLAHFKDSFLHGYWYPRWLPDLHGGYGYPTFVFYQPLIFFMSLLFSFLPTVELAHSIHIASWFFLFLGVTGVYLVGMEVSKRNKLSALFGSVLFLLTPYLAVNLHVRGDLSELSAMCLIPWSIYFGLAIKRRFELHEDLNFWNLIALAGSIGLIVISHPAIALFYVPSILFLFTLIIFVTMATSTIKSRIRLLLILYSSIFLGILFSIEYWLPVMQLGREVHLENAIQGYFLPYKHALNIKQLFSNFWGYGISTWEVQGPDTMPFQLGLPHFLISLFGFFLHRKEKLVWIFFTFYIGFIAIMLLPSPRFWTLPLIVKTQFPWRMLSITATLQAILGVYATTLFQNRPKIQALVQIIILVAIIGYTPAMFQPDPRTLKIDTNSYRSISAQAENDQKNASFKLITWAVKNEFLPKQANTKIGVRGEQYFINASPDDSICLYDDFSQYYLHFSIKVTNDRKVEIRQFYFPGWRVFINDVEIEDEFIKGNLSKNGTIQIPINKLKNYEILAFYDAPPGILFRQIAVLLGIFIFTVIFLYYRRNNFT